MTKEMEKEAGNMCDYSKMIEDRGIAKGIAKGRAEGVAKGIAKGILSSIKNLMETTGMTAAQAMDALKVPDSDRAMYAAKL